MKFLHSADWQMGARFAQFGECAGNLRQARLTTLRRALEVARQQQAKSYQLRATTSLAHLWHQQGKSTEAKAMLSEAISVWPEGLDTADLRDARHLRHLLCYRS